MFELRCKDVGFDCRSLTMGLTKEEVLKQAAAHAAEVHHTQVTAEISAKVSALIREQKIS